MRWILQTLREAAWAPLLVLGAVIVAEGIFGLFARFPWVDIPAHFLGGIAVTNLYWRAAANAQTLTGRVPKLGRGVLAFGCTAGTAFLWEVFEFACDRFLGAHMQHGLGDTLSDLVFGLGGGLAYLALRRARTNLPARPGPVE
jgi:hypothetical protein